METQVRVTTRAVTTRGDDLGRDGCSEICGHTHVLDLGITTAAGTGAGYTPPVIAVEVVGQNRSHRAPIARIEARHVARVGSACRVFQPRCRPAELIESRERRVDVFPFEELEAAD